MRIKRRVEQLLGYIEWSTFRASRRIREAMHNPRLFFMHIPKTGGTSVKNMLRKNRKSWYDGHVDAKKTRNMIRSVSGHEIGRENFFEELFKLRQELAASHLSSQKPIISGHIPLNREILAKFSDYSFFTVIKNPVKRWISNYRFSYSISGMESFFDKEPPDHPADGIKRALTSDSVKFQRNIYTIYFSGYGWEPLDESLKTKAKDNIKSIDKIFLTEKMSEVEKYIRNKSFINEEIKEKKKDRRER